jgi:hypothetical protein
MARASKEKEPQPVVVTFETELAQIQEKGKDLKGDQKVFYNSIVERVANNVHVLADQREEHAQLRIKLGELVKEKASLSQRVDLEGDIRHTQHSVNLQKKQYDKLRQERSDSLEAQRELEIVLANFRSADIYEQPENAMIADMKNKLDRANIKNGEAARLITMYQRIIYCLDRQKMQFAPVVEKEREVIARQGRDIKELALISRDSRFASLMAVSEYRSTKQEVSNSKKERNSTLEKKRLQAMRGRQQQEAEPVKAPVRVHPSLSSQPSVLRNRMNKAAREKREERYRQVSSIYDSVRDFFGTTDPPVIRDFFEERKQNAETLAKQIEELRAVCKDLQAQADRLKSQIEEAEYTSAKGVGTDRLLAEGRTTLDDKCEQRKKAARELEAVSQHQKQVASGSLHLRDMMSLVEGEVVGEEEEEEEERSDEPKVVLQWIHGKVVQVQAALDNEDLDWLALVNKQNFALQKMREDAALDPDKPHQRTMKTQGFKRPAKDNRLDVTTRVLDRSTVKQLAAKTVLSHSQQTKKAAKLGK